MEYGIVASAIGRYGLKCVTRRALIKNESRLCSVTKSISAFSDRSAGA